MSGDSLLRGAEAIADYINSRLGGGEPVSTHAVYRMIEGGMIPVTRIGSKRSEVWATIHRIDEAFGLRTKESAQ